MGFMKMGLVTVIFTSGTFCRNGKHCQKVLTVDKPRKGKIYDSGKEKQFKEK